MIIEQYDNLRFVKKLCDWLDDNGMSSDYFFGELADIGLKFPIKVNSFVEEDAHFSFICSSKNSDDPVTFKVILYSDLSKYRIVSFENPNGFWKQDMAV